MNILFIGSSSLFSLIPLVELWQSNYTVCAVATNEISDNKFSTVTTGSLQEHSFSNSIPLINLNDSTTSVVSQIEIIQPDVILVSCYTKLVPESILILAKKGAFNLHPSLLPRFRGPTPMFWQLRDGISDFGVTLHRMDSGFDKGNIKVSASASGITSETIEINVK